MSGVETSLPLMLTQAMQGRCSVAQVAQAYGIPKKRAIAPSYDADLILVNLNPYHPVLREELLTKYG